MSDRTINRISTVIETVTDIFVLAVFIGAASVGLGMASGAI